MPVNDLPGAQDALVWKLPETAGLKEKLVLLNQLGSPVHIPWIYEVLCVMQTWHGDQEAGNALWNVLSGLVGPSRRLPITWTREYGDLGFDDKEKWPGVNSLVKYKEIT